MTTVAQVAKQLHPVSVTHSFTILIAAVAFINTIRGQGQHKVSGFEARWTGLSKLGVFCSQQPHHEMSSIGTK
jgi:hypothetical protein